MTKAYRVIASTLTLIFALSSPASAWNTRGHMMVAAIAYQNLTQKTKDRVDALLLLNPDRDNWLVSSCARVGVFKRRTAIVIIRFYITNDAKAMLKSGQVADAVKPAFLLSFFSFY